MDVVGFAASNHSIIVLDPDNTRYGAIGFAGTNASPPPTGLFTNYDGYATPYTLSLYTTNNPFPVENGWADVGAPTNSLLQSYTVDANGFITSGIYAGTKVDEFFAIGPVPEPSSIALGLLSVAAFRAYRRRRSRSEQFAAINRHLVFPRERG
jgi:MYXO-CTERM domain-containing protein